MRKYLLLAWLLIPVIIIAVHYGPGRKYRSMEAATHQIKHAEELEIIAETSNDPDDWLHVVEAYRQALVLTPPENKLAASRIKLAAARAQMYEGELVEAITELESLLQDARMEDFPTGHQNDIRDTLARSQFGAAWVMRLEGAGTDLWTKQAENARQNFRLLAENAMKTDNAAAPDHQKNLEATIRMTQMDASIIKGLPLPREAENGQGKGVGDKMGEAGEQEGQEGIGPTQEGDARGKGAGQGERPEGVGS
ncbi:MAG: hypothetical protein JW709_01580 [Sedimentisphaerales bacterium]|nr:hypothetical protein [Sedimentisphaerales bacterium]